MLRATNQSSHSAKHASQKNLTFGSAYTHAQEQLAKKTWAKAQKLFGTEGGDRILIVHTPSLPSEANKDTGLGKPNSNILNKFFEIAKTYAGINVVKELPPGENFSMNVRKGFYCNYACNSTSTGSQYINIHRLTDKDHGRILTPEDADKLVKSNKKTHKENWVNYENEETQHHKPILELVKKAYQRYLKQDTPEKISLKKDFEAYKIEDQERLEKQSSHRDDKEFYKFWQFLADKHLQEGREARKAQGLLTEGDNPIGSSREEVAKNPEAFDKGAYIGLPHWGLPAWDFEKINNPDGSLGPTGKYIKKKAEYYFKRYDRVRFDVGWAFTEPLITKDGHTYSKKLEPADSIFKIIEDTAKEVYGEEDVSKRLSYEVEAGPDEFQPFHWGDVIRQKDALKGRKKIFTTAHENINDRGWGTPHFFKKVVGMNDDELLLGVGTHDNTSLREIAENKDGKYTDKKKEAIESLAHHLKVDKNKLEDPKEFEAHKHAHVIGESKNWFIFQNDFFGRAQSIDDQTNSPNNYRTRFDEKFEEEYHKALQDGHGFNQMEAVAIAMKSKGLDKEHKEIYEDALNLGKILREKGPLTKEAAERNNGKKQDNNAKTSPKVLKWVLGALGLGGIGAGIYAATKNKHPKEVEFHTAPPQAPYRQTLHSQNYSRHYRQYNKHS